MRRILKVAVPGGVLAFALIQLVPYGRDHDNPPVTAEPRWAGERTRALAFRACFACHSNETEWPWYANVAPFSWLLQRDVDGGRKAVNFSEWDREQDADDLAEVVEEGTMPPGRYLVIHPSARLSDPEKRSLIDGLAATLELSPPPDGDSSGPGDGGEGEGNGDGDSSGPGDGSGSDQG